MRTRNALQVVVKVLNTRYCVIKVILEQQVDLPAVATKVKVYLTKCILCTHWLVQTPEAHKINSVPAKICSSEISWL